MKIVILMKSHKIKTDLKQIMKRFTRVLLNNYKHKIKMIKTTTTYIIYKKTNHTKYRKSLSN